MYLSDCWIAYNFNCHFLKIFFFLHKDERMILPFFQTESRKRCDVKYELINPSNYWSRRSCPKAMRKYDFSWRADQLSFEGKSPDIFWLPTKIWHGNKWLETPWKCMVCSTETNYLADGRQITRLGNLAWFSFAFFKAANFLGAMRRTRSSD